MSLQGQIFFSYNWYLLKYPFQPFSLNFWNSKLDAKQMVTDRHTYKCKHITVLACTQLVKIHPLTNTNIHKNQTPGWITAISRVNQSNLVISNYSILHGELVMYSRKTVIKASGSRVLWWSGSLHVQLIWRQNSWPLNSVFTSHEVRSKARCIKLYRFMTKNSVQVCMIKLFQS